MHLIPAPGSPEMQAALSHSNVRTIVDILLQIIDQDYFKVVALFLRNNDQDTSPSLSQKLQALRNQYKPRPNAEGRFAVPPYIDELVSTLEILYSQDQIRVSFQRGAIVELLASELVCSRCNSGECVGNHIFVDGRYRSSQVDVAVFSKSKQQIEGYTCKTKPEWVESADCTNLIALASKAQELDFDTHIGVICFDHSRAIDQRIKKFPLRMPIQAYGINNIQVLTKSPIK